MKNKIFIIGSSGYIGKELMNHAIEDSKKNKVYKVILDCKDDMITYYEKFGYESKNVQMSLYFE